MKKWTLVLTLLASVGCNDPGNRHGAVNVVGSSILTGPSAVRAEAFMVQPAFLNPRSISGAVCPTRPPLLAPLSLGFRGDGRSGLFLSGVQMQFIDRTGIVGGSMAVGRTDLVRRFRSITLPAFGTRFFPFEFPFGCVGLPTGTLTVIVLTEDASRRESRTTMQVPIR